MHDLFLWLFSGLALLGAVGTVSSRHPINSAMSLVLTFLAVASIYALLDAHLLAAIQVIVYVGAIMLFVIYTILLMDIRIDDLAGRVSPVAAGPLVVLGLAWLVLIGARISDLGPPPVPSVPEGFGTVRGIAMELFTEHLYTFEMVSILLLAAIVGALVLARQVAESTTVTNEADG